MSNPMILHNESLGGCTCFRCAPCAYCESAYEACDECREPVADCICEKEQPAVDENTFFFGDESLPPPSMDDILDACKKARELQVNQYSLYGLSRPGDIQHHPLLDTMGFDTLPYPHWPWWTFLWRKRLRRAWNRDTKNRVAVPLIYRIGDRLVCNKLGYDKLMAMFQGDTKP